MKTLEKLGLVFFAVMMCINFTACGDDNDEGKSGDSIVGTWELAWSKGYEIWEGKKGAWDEAVGDYFITFNADGTGVDNDVEYPEDNENFIWEVKGKKIYVLYASEDFQTEADIDKLTENTLVISYSEKDFSTTETFKRVK